MAWTIGEWKRLGEGEIHQVMKKCINILLKDGFTLEIDLGIEKKPLQYGRELYKVLKEFEKQHGTNDLLELLTKGLKIECKKNSEMITIRIEMRTPSASEERAQLYKDIIIAWIEEKPLTFIERFFRLPKISEDIADRYLDNPLEKTLKRTFGFDFIYRVIIQYKGNSNIFSQLRKKLYRSLR